MSSEVESEVGDEGSERVLPLRGFKVEGFRTLKSAEVVCNGMLTVVCGPNNSGKSSLLDALSRYPAMVAAASENPKQRGKEHDPSGFGSDSVQCFFGIPITSDCWLPVGGSSGMERARAREIVDEMKERYGDAVWWVPLKESNKPLQLGDTSLVLKEIQEAISHLDREDRVLITAVRGKPRNPPVVDQNWLKEVMSRLPVPKVESIGDIRRQVDAPLSQEDLRKLARASNISPSGRREERWTEILGEILTDTFGEGVSYQVLPSRETGEFRISMDGQQDVPLDQVGAGVREVVAIAFKALEGGDHASDRPLVMTIEEPENCLHPLAVRRLLWSLIKQVGVQLIVSTHSSSVLDSRPDSIIRVVRSDEASEAILISKTAERFEAIRSLGYSPADVLMAPCVVWVEGPSDRVYLRAWLAHHAIEEGIDYQIMFYGGSLGANLSAEMEADEVEEELAAMRVVARRCVLVADSDKTEQQQRRLKPHVRRWKKEAQGDPNAEIWVTPVREIENLLPLDTINEYRKRHRVPTLRPAEHEFSSVFDGINRPRKVELAKRVIAECPDVPEPAAKDVRRIAEFIKASRDRSTGTP